jgi:hypothetical protein
MRDIFIEQQKTITNLNEGKLEILKNQKKINEINNRSYASALKQSINKECVKNNTKHVVLIYPDKENNEITSEELKTQVKTNLNLRELGSIGINKGRVYFSVHVQCVSK